MARNVTTKAKTPEGILKAVARLIREKGWCQNERNSPDGRVCLVEALAQIIPYSADESRNTLYNKAYALIKKRLGLVERDFLFAWNDAPGRKKEEVLAVLER